LGIEKRRPHPFAIKREHSKVVFSILTIRYSLLAKVSMGAVYSIKRRMGRGKG
jgi:hypothetical protein